MLMPLCFKNAASASLLVSRSVPRNVRREPVAPSVKRWAKIASIDRLPPFVAAHI